MPKIHAPPFQYAENRHDCSIIAIFRECSSAIPSHIGSRRASSTLKLVAACSRSRTGLSRNDSATCPPPRPRSKKSSRRLHAVSGRYRDQVAAKSSVFRRGGVIPWPRRIVANFRIRGRFWLRHRAATRRLACPASRLAKSRGKFRYLYSHRDCRQQRSHRSRVRDWETFV